MCIVKNSTHSKLARKPRIYATLKLRPTYLLTRVKSRATNVAKNYTKVLMLATNLRYGVYMRYGESEAGVGIPVFGESDCRSKKWRKLHILQAPPGTPVVIQQGGMTLLFGVYPLGSMRPILNLTKYRVFFYTGPSLKS